MTVKNNKIKKIYFKKKYRIKIELKEINKYYYSKR